MTPDAHAHLLEWLTDGPFDGMLHFQNPNGETQVVHGRIEAVGPAQSVHPPSHVQVTDTDGTVTVIAIADLTTVFVTLMSQPGTAQPTVSPASPVDPVEQARQKVFEQVEAILDYYDETDDGELVAECAPEDRWRLYRDLYLLTGRTHPDADESQA